MRLPNRVAERLFCRISRHDLKPFSLQIVLQYLTDILFVVYNKYFHKLHKLMGAKLAIIPKKIGGLD